MLDKGSIIVMATHATDLAKQLCDRAIWLDSGMVKMDGPIDDVMDAYLAWSGV
jgi:lipopolysaccharide transport system ATP-binding protein